MKNNILSVRLFRDKISRMLYLLHFLLFIFFSIHIGFTQGNALDFDGNNDQVILPNIPALGNVFTLEYYVFYKGGDDTFDRVLSSSPLQLDINTGGSGSFDIKFWYTETDWSGCRWESTNYFIQPGTWVHMAWVNDGNGLKLYTDGMLVYNAPFCNASLVPNSFTLGTNKSGTQAGHIILDELRIWAIARSQADIQDKMGEELSGSETSLIAYYNFNQGTAGADNSSETTLIDVSGNGYDGMLRFFTLDGNSTNWIASTAPVISTTPVKNQSQKILASDGKSYDNFGFSLDIDESTAIVGARRKDETEPKSGAAYIFEKINGNWSEATKLIASDGENYDNFGYEVSISGTTAVVGSWGDDDNGSDAGAAYIFEKENGEWKEKTKIKASDGGVYARFGARTAVNENTILVGAPFNSNQNGSNAGAVYVFQKVGNEWIEQQKLISSDAQSYSYFGGGVALDNTIMVISADGNHGNRKGKVYIFEKMGGVWTEVTELTDFQVGAADLFSLGVDISGETIVISVTYDNTNGIASGAAFVYERINGNWIEKAKIDASDGESYDYLGVNSAIDDKFIIIGASGYDDPYSRSGVAYVYEKINDDWVESRKLAVSDGKSYDLLGVGIGVSNNIALVGAPFNDDKEPNAGSAYFFNLSICDLAITNISQTNESCPGNMDAVLTVSTTCTNCIGSLEYSIDGINFDNTTGVFLNLSPDTYTIHVRDAELHTCVATASQTIDPVCNLTINNTVVTKETCPGANDGTISISTTCANCVGAIEYSIDGTTFFNNSGVFSNLVPGGYTVFVRDADKICCTDMVTVEIGAACDLEIGAIDITEETCPGEGGVLTVNASCSSCSGSIGYSLDGTDFSNTSGVFSDVSTGDFTVYARDNGNPCCFASTNGKMPGSLITATTIEEIVRLVNSDGGIAHGFGTAIAIDDSVAVIGAPGHNNRNGAAYVFEKRFETWVQVAKLSPDSPIINNRRVGWSVDISGNTIVVGSYQSASGGLRSGIAYVYEKPAGGWADMTQTALLRSGDIGVGVDYNAHAVGIDGDVIVVGAGEKVNGDFRPGAVLIYEKSSGGWEDAFENDIIFPENPFNLDFFGLALDFENGLLTVAARGIGANNPGYVRLYRKINNVWTRIAILTPSDGSNPDRFGVSVRNHLNTVVVGSPYHNDTIGAVYVFEEPVGGWTNMTETAKLTPSDGNNQDFFGVSVDIYGETILSGSFYNDALGDSSGAVYLYKKPENGWANATEDIKLVPKNGQAGDEFGTSVEIYGTNILIGARQDYEDNNFGKPGYVSFYEEQLSQEISGDAIDNFINSDTYWSKKTISSEGMIIPDEQVKFISGESILLKPGFHAIVGSEFLAMIESCEEQNFTDNRSTEERENHAGKPMSDEFSKLVLDIYPNPFSGIAQLNFQLPEPEQVSISVFDQSGRRILNLFTNENLAAGIHQTELGTKHLYNGFFFVIFQTSKERIVRKVLVLD